MPNYRPTKFGMVEASVLDPSMKMITDSMKIYLTSSQNYDYLQTPSVISDLLKSMKMITGDDFPAWLKAVYNNGTGVRAEIVRRMLSFLSGETDGMMLVEAITRGILS